MTNRWWALFAVSALTALLCPPALPAQTCAAPAQRLQAGYLAVPVKLPDGCYTFQVIPYYPQPGDLLLCDYFNKLHTFAFKMIGTGPPVHSAIVFDHTDGTPLILDIAGPKTLTAKVVLYEVWPRMKNYPGTILVRRPREPVCPERSAALTQFALTQNGKSFAVARLALQGTPFRPRTCPCFAGSCINREKWICSELIVVAAATAGLVDLEKNCSNAIFPRDLAYDEHCNLSETYQEPVLWIADPEPLIHDGKVVVLRGGPPAKDNYLIGQVPSP